LKPRGKAVRLALLRGAVKLGRIAGRIETEARHRISVHHLYRPRPDDIFVVSYPKSGTTLLQMMLYQLSTDGNLDFPHLAGVSPWFEDLLRYGFEDFVEALPSPRIFKSHLRYHRLPRGVRTIYLMRHFRDAAVSAYHHHCLVTGYEPPFAAFASDIIDGRVMFGSWFKHVQSWWPHRHDPNVLFLRFEEMIADLAGTARRVAAFWGLPLSTKAMARIVERCSLHFMKQHDAKFDPRLRQLSRFERTFIRKGVVGDGRNAFTPAQEELLADRLAALARELGCSPSDLDHDRHAPGPALQEPLTSPAASPGRDSAR
jgi:hypothetical protein